MRSVGIRAFSQAAQRGRDGGRSGHFGGPAEKSSIASISRIQETTASTFGYNRETLVSGSTAYRSDRGLAEQTLGIASLSARELRARIVAGRDLGDPQADALVERFVELP